MDVELAPVACLAFVRHSTTEKAQSDSEDDDRARALTEVEYPAHAGRFAARARPAVRSDSVCVGCMRRTGASWLRHRAVGLRRLSTATASLLAFLSLPLLAGASRPPT